METITLTADSATTARVAHSFGVFLGLGRDATLAEITAQFRMYAASVVKTVEQQEAASATVNFT